MARRDAFSTAPTQCRSFSCTDAVGIFTIYAHGHSYFRISPTLPHSFPHAPIYTDDAGRWHAPIPRRSEEYDYGYNISDIFTISKHQNATYAARPNGIKYVNWHLGNGEKCIIFTQRKAGICIACVSPLSHCCLSTTYKHGDVHTAPPICTSKKNAKYSRSSGVYPRPGIVPFSANKVPCKRRTTMESPLNIHKNSPSARI